MKPDLIHIGAPVILVFACCELITPINEFYPEQISAEKQSVVGNIPLNDPEFFTYNGLSSGLYPWGNDLIDNQYNTNYLAVSSSIQPLNKEGVPGSKAKTVILGIGGSQAYRLFSGIRNAWSSDPGFGKKLVFANAGTGGKDLPDIIETNASYWKRVIKVLDSNKVNNLQVQVIFIVEDDFINRDTTIQRAHTINGQFQTLLNTIREKFPNVKLVLFADRGYSGYSTLSKYDEPKGYLNGWAVKLVAEDYINGNIPSVPFVNWYEYYWANGEEPRWDGLTYLISDFEAPEFAHYTVDKCNALGVVTHNKLKTDPGCSNWYK